MSMEQKLKEFFEKNEADEREAFLKERTSVLIKCGLYSEEKQFYDVWEFGCRYDPITEKHYKNVKVPFDVTDDEYERILKIYHKGQRAAEKENAAEQEKLRLEQIDLDAEKRLDNITSVISVLTVFGAIALLIAGFFLNGELYDLKPLPVILGIVLSITVLVEGLLFRALHKVVINISRNLHSISAKTSSNKD